MAYSINSIPKLAQDKVISLSAIVKVSGKYTLSFEYGNFWGDLDCVIFKDKFLNVSFPITADTSYTCIISDTTSISRFELTIGQSIHGFQTDVSCRNALDGKISATGLGAGPWDYTWKNEDDSIIRSVSASNAMDELSNIGWGIYSLNIANSGLCGTQTAVFELENPQPVVSLFNLNSDTLYLSMNAVLSLQNLSRNASSYTWDFGDASTSVDFEPSHQYKKDGLYTIHLISSQSSCSDSSEKEVAVIDDLSGITDVSSESNSLEIFSYQDKIYVKGFNPEGSRIRFKVVSEDGRLVEKRSTSSRVVYEEFTNMPVTGIYLVQVSASGEDQVVKVMVR
jgi:hypothetical protein